MLFCAGEEHISAALPILHPTGSDLAKAAPGREADRLTRRHRPQSSPSLSAHSSDHGCRHEGSHVSPVVTGTRPHRSEALLKEVTAIPASDKASTLEKYTNTKVYKSTQIQKVYKAIRIQIPSW